MPDPKREDFEDPAFTQVEEDVWVCNDCGAHAGSPRDIKHYPSCQPGESAYWEDFYARQEEDKD